MSFTILKDWGNPRQMIRGDINLKKIVLPEGLTNVEVNSICENPELEIIQFPSTLAFLGNRAVNNCPLLKSIVVLALVPPIYEDNALHGNNSTSIFYVPDESMDIYKNATNWIALYPQGRLKPLSEFTE